jgi:hypothetical protein
MMFNRFGLFPIPMPLLNMDGGGGMGGDGGDAGAGSGGGSLETPAEPSVIDIDDGAMIRIKGQDKPVKFGDHVKGFQSQFTKASQRAAELERKLQHESQLRQQFEQQARAAAQRQQGGGQQEDVFASLRQLPYLTGEDAVGVVQNIAQQIQQRDQVLMGALKKMQQLQQVVNGLHSSSSQSAFEGKIAKYLQEGGYDPAHYGDFAKELYVAYEGDDLDSEFPQILASRIEQLEKAFAAKNAAKVAANRKQPFVPGRGGSTHPSRPLEIKPNASSREIADLLFPGFSGQSDT